MIETIIAAVIGAIATIAAAIIGRQTGFRKGREEGQRHSILKFLDVQQDQLDRAMEAVNRRDYRQLEAISVSLVDEAQTWRQIQENFQTLLNGRIDELARILELRIEGGQRGRYNPERLSYIEYNIRALHESYRAKRLAIETELEKSSI